MRDRTPRKAAAILGWRTVSAIESGTKQATTTSASSQEYATITPNTKSISSVETIIAAPVHCMRSRMTSTSPVTRET